MNKHPKKDRPTVADVAAKNASKIDLVARDRILAMLSDVEVASVSTAESKPHLKEGEEYLDLERLDQGVRRANGLGAPMGHVLPKKAVGDATWTAIVTKLKPTAAASQG